MAGFDSFRDVIFMFELAQLPEELKVVHKISGTIRDRADTAHTMIQVATSLEEAAPMVDNFKAKTCGSTYNLAIINLNMIGSAEELKFLLRADVLGDPRTIFLASLRYMVGEAYAFAREKVQAEHDSRIGGTPSCIDCYSATNRDELYPRISELAVAYLKEGEERHEAKRRGEINFVAESHAARLLNRSSTTFYGKRIKTTGVSGRLSDSRFPRIGGPGNGT